MLRIDAKSIWYSQDLLMGIPLLICEDFSMFISDKIYLFHVPCTSLLGNHVLIFTEFNLFTREQRSVQTYKKM